MFVALKSLHSPVVFSYKVLSRFYESFDHPSVEMVVNGAHTQYYWQEPLTMLLILFTRFL